MTPHPSHEPSLRSQAHDWLLLLTSGRATVADAHALQQWCEQSPAHAEAFESARVLWQQLQPAAQQAHKVVPLRQMRRRAFLGGAIAASAGLVMLGGGMLDGLGQPAADFHTAVGEQRKVQLAQGVDVELNTQTRISRLGTSGLQLLEGELQVKASAPVLVQAGDAQLNAELAWFNLRQIGEQICLTCLAGQVQVHWQGRAITLASGRQLRYDRKAMGEPQAFDATEVMAWREQLLVFHDAPLVQVIDEINRYRPGMLVLLNPSLGRRKVQARFTLAQLPGVVSLIRDAYGVRCTELPGGVVLIS
ncbi:FecR family protein [Pseudomonas sp. NPDC089554]|uniref:FecR family protein n=1 Tax=Pseudomonas sp. NPDC089554 TaxID=3390653 RepID=UPI003CFF686D